MKKIVLCLLAISFLTFISCKKEKEDTTPTQPPTPQPEEVNYADDFVGDYIISGTMTLNLPELLGGTQTMPITESELTITANGTHGDVIIVSGTYQFDGYANARGLHVDPIMIDYPIMNTTVSFTATIPTIEKPVDGSTSFTASLVTTVQGMTITGSADIIATQQ